MDSLQLTPVGYLHCKQQYTYDAPRQSVLACNNTGFIKLNKGCNFEQALEDLSGFDRIWVLYQFHMNTGWKPKTIPPRSINHKKIGLFATRSPYRPNPIGLSCVELTEIKGLKLYIRNFDLIDKTPILDIKPYIPYCDSFPDSKTGWLEKINNCDNWNCSFSDSAIEQIEWVVEKTGFDIAHFCKVQLSHAPLDSKKKRVQTIDKNKNIHVLSYRTWRIIFTLEPFNNTCNIIKIHSGYSSEEINDIENDKYSDKKYHKEFNLIF